MEEVMVNRMHSSRQRKATLERIRNHRRCRMSVPTLAALLLASAIGVTTLDARQQSMDSHQAQPAPSPAAGAVWTPVFQPQGDTYRSPTEPRVPRQPSIESRTNDEPERLENDPHDRPIGSATWTAVGIVSAALLVAAGLAFVARPQWDHDAD
jgi:hypothetical protein